MNHSLLLVIFPLLLFSCAKESVEPLSRIPDHSSFVDLTFTDIHTNETVGRGVTAVHPVTTLLRSGVYWKGPNYYLTKELSVDVEFPTGDTYMAVLTYHKLQEDRDVIEVYPNSKAWKYSDSGDYHSYYDNHFQRISIREKNGDYGGAVYSVDTYQASPVSVDGVKKTRVDITLNAEFINTVYSPRDEQRGFRATGTLTLYLD